MPEANIVRNSITVKSLARNSTYTMIAQIWRMGSRFILTPVIITYLGWEGYGVWTLLLAICACVSVIDVNFGVAYNKFTAEYDAKQEFGHLAQIIGAGMILVGSIAAVALTVLWLLRAPVLSTLGVPESMVPQAGQALLVISACVLMRMSVGCVFPMLDGLQRLDLRQKITIVTSIIEFVISIVLLYRGWELMALAVGYFCGQVVGTVTAWRYCRRLCPALKISPLQSSVAGLRQITSLGGRFQAMSILQLLIQQGSQMLISALFGVSTLGIYEIARKLVWLGKAAGSAVIGPVLPAFSSLQASGDREKLKSLYRRSSNIVLMVSIPSLAFLGIFADQLILLWTGQSSPLAAWTVRLIAPVALLTMLTGIGTAALRARGTIRLEFTRSVLAASMLAVFYGPGYWLGGYQGIIVAQFVAGIVSSIWFLVVAGRAESLSDNAFLRDTVFRPMIVFGPLIALVILIYPILHLPDVFERTRINVLMNVVVWGTLFVVTSGLCGWYGLLSRPERASLGRHLPGGGNGIVQHLLAYADK